MRSTRSASALERVVQGQVASVHQIFTGPVAGDALLILDESGAAILKELLTNEPALPLAIDASAREVITEVGNILLNACLGTFGNLLKVQVSFSVPHLSIEHVGAILESLRSLTKGIRYALVVHAGFRLRDTQVTGYMVIVLSVASLDRLIRAVEEWEQCAELTMSCKAQTSTRSASAAARVVRGARRSRRLHHRRSPDRPALEPLAGGADRQARRRTWSGGRCSSCFRISSTRGLDASYRDALAGEVRHPLAALPQIPAADHPQLPRRRADRDGADGAHRAAHRRRRGASARSR